MTIGFPGLDKKCEKKIEDGRKGWKKKMEAGGGRMEVVTVTRYNSVFVKLPASHLQLPTKTKSISSEFYPWIFLWLIHRSIYPDNGYFSSVHLRFLLRDSRK